MLARRKATTLAEVILALGLFVVVILSATQLAFIALNSNTKTTDEIAADTLAQQTIENFIYGLPPGSSTFWTTTTFAVPYQQDTVNLGTQSFQRALYVTDYGLTVDGLRSVRVRISWGNGDVGKAGQGVQIAEVTRLVSAP